jgi:hypothetical protein
VRIDREVTALAVLSGALGVAAALTLSAPSALADPLPSEPVAPAVALADPAIGTPAAIPGPAPDGTVQPTAVDPSTLPDGVAHLSSPEQLPPGTTDTPPEGGQRRLGYLRDLWHAVQTQEVSGGDALLLLTQRPMDADAVPPPGMPANPTPPLPPEPALPVLPAPTP